MIGRIVLYQMSPIKYKILQEIVRIDSGKVVNSGGCVHGIIEPLEKSVDGHWAVFSVNRADHVAEAQ